MTGYEAVHENAAWLDLSSRGRLIVSGEDAGRLLHALSTNDVKNLANGEGLYAFFLNAQGRILADAYIFRRGEAFFLDSEPETLTKLRDHIDKYIIADDAAVEVLEGWGELSIEGPHATRYAAALELPVPEQSLSTLPWKGGFTARLGACTRDGIRAFGPEEQIKDIRSRLEMPELSAAEARIVRLENGIPRYGEDISERYLVQETGQLHGIHFNKGCYLGQEIVERVRSRAQIHRHLHPVRIKSDTAPPAATKLTSEGKDAAEITSAAYSPSLKEVVALAYVRTESLETRPALKVSGSDTDAYLV